MRISWKLAFFFSFPPFCWTTEGLSVGLQKDFLLDYRKRFCWITPLGGFYYPKSGRVLSQLLSQLWGFYPKEGFIPSLGGFIPTLGGFYGRVLSQLWEASIPTMGGFYPNSRRVLSQLWECSIPTLGGFSPNSGKALSQLWDSFSNPRCAFKA